MKQTDKTWVLLMCAREGTVFEVLIGRPNEHSYARCPDCNGPIEAVEVRPADSSRPEERERIRVLEDQRDGLATEVATTIETLTRGDEIPVPADHDPTKPPDPNPLQGVIDRLSRALSDHGSEDR